MISLVFIIVFALYAVLVIFLYVGWRRAIHAKREPHRQHEFISVIIPVRNESANIGFLLDDLLQGRSRDFFEVIIVDDHSEDNTKLVVESKLNSYPHSNDRIIPSSGHGKKAALATGIQHAKGDIIVTTDADCRVSPTWVHSVNLAFANDNIKMVVGPVRIESNQTFFSKLQSIEFSSLIGTGAATLEFGIPTMCNGANLAFRREVFLEVNGYEGNENVASGDDEFLLRKISEKYPNGISFNNSQNGIVSTQPQQTIAQFFSQRLRWAGKWKHHHDLKSKILALSVFTFHVMVLSLLIIYAAHLISGTILLSLLASKMIIEFIFLSTVTSWLGIRWSWASFLLLQFIYPVYAIYTGFASLFLNPSWKGRK